MLPVMVLSAYFAISPYGEASNIAKKLISLAEYASRPPVTKSVPKAISAVACGRLATYCESSSDGSAVACGGKAKR
jgi:hypothetical protein